MDERASLLRDLTLPEVSGGVSGGAEVQLHESFMSHDPSIKKDTSQICLSAHKYNLFVMPRQVFFTDTLQNIGMCCSIETRSATSAAK